MSRTDLGRRPQAIYRAPPLGTHDSRDHFSMTRTELRAQGPLQAGDDMDYNSDNFRRRQRRQRCLTLHMWVMMNGQGTRKRSEPDIHPA